MKARKRVRRFLGFMVGGLFFALGQTAFGQSFSEGKNLFQLRETAFPSVSSNFVLLSNKGFALMNVRETSKISNHVICNHQYFAGINIPNPQSLIPNHRMLPRWSAENLPFFCRIEHDFAKKSAVPFKFRLGSVEYVDWLEGKGNDWSH